VQRRRIAHAADGAIEVPAAHAWQTLCQVAITPGLRDAACDGMLRDSAHQTVARLDARAGERGVLAKTTILEIVHTGRGHLQEAAHARDPEALRRLVPPTSPAEEEAPSRTVDEGAAVEEMTAPALIEFRGGPTDPPQVPREDPRVVDPDVVLIELDEVVVHAQAHTGRKQVLAPTAVMSVGWCWHLAAATRSERSELTYQVGALFGGFGSPPGHAAAAGADRRGPVDPGMVRGTRRPRPDLDRVLVAPGQARGAGPQSGLSRLGAPPHRRGGGAQGVVAGTDRGRLAGAAVPAGCCSPGRKR